MVKWGLGAAVLFASVSVGWAQSGAPISRTIPVTFTGTVTNDVTNTIRIRQPDGGFANFSGPVPDYPYKVGDAVTISFNATVPTRAFYDPANGYTGQVSADGIYRVQVSPPVYNGGTGPGGIGNSSNFSVTGPAPIGQATNSGQPTNFGAVIVYNANDDSYSLDNATTRSLAGLVSVPGYNFDPATGQLSACGTGIGQARCGIDGNASLSASANQVSATNATINNSATGGASGLFNLIFGGSWNLPTWNGGATQVPEPGMMFLFGGGAGALMLRRRKRRAS